MKGLLGVLFPEILENIRIFLILELESSISQKKYFFFGEDCFYFWGWGLSWEVRQVALKTTSSSLLIHSFTLKVALFENSNRTLSLNSGHENSEWSLASFAIKNLCRFHVVTI